MPTNTKKLIRALGTDGVAYLTNETERKVRQWLDGSAEPDVDQLDVIVFTWSVYDRLYKAGMVNQHQLIVWFNTTMLDKKTTVSLAIREGRYRNEILDLVTEVEDEV